MFVTYSNNQHLLDSRKYCRIFAAFWLACRIQTRSSLYVCWGDGLQLPGLFIFWNNCHSSDYFGGVLCTYLHRYTEAGKYKILISHKRIRSNQGSITLFQMNTNLPVINIKDDSNSKGGKEPIRALRRQRGGTMLRVLGAAQKREVKATQNLSIIVLFFMICWMPLYTINCINAFCSMCLDDIKLTNFCIILSHLNSGKLLLG